MVSGAANSRVRDAPRPQATVVATKENKLPPSVCLVSWPSAKTNCHHSLSSRRHLEGPVRLQGAPLDCLFSLALVWRIARALPRNELVRRKLTCHRRVEGAPLERVLSQIESAQTALLSNGIHLWSSSLQITLFT